MQDCSEKDSVSLYICFVIKQTSKQKTNNSQDYILQPYKSNTSTYPYSSCFLVVLQLKCSICWNLNLAWGDWAAQDTAIKCYWVALWSMAVDENVGL